MNPSKRLFDIAVALVLMVVLLPIMIVIAIAIILFDGPPVLYVSERMRDPVTGFRLLKFRTMKTVSTDSGVSGGDKSSRVTRTGKVLRRFRLDELPQIFNVLRGDLSFVGPRPPLRQYVERFPTLYAEVLKSRPGVTGLASIVYHHHEERLLSACRTIEETDAVYCRNCVPRKGRLDLIYQARRTLCMDIWLMLRTALRF